MKKSLLNKTAAIIAALLLIVFSVCGCGDGCFGAPEKDRETGTHTAEPGSSEPGSSTEPGTVTGDPNTQDPAATGAPSGTPDPGFTAQPGETGSPSDPTPAPFVTPVPGTPVPTNPPEDVTVDGTTWIDGNCALKCDLDKDGIIDRLEITVEGDAVQTVTVKVTVGSTGAVITDSVTADRIGLAVLNDFNPSDNRFELLVNTRTGNRADHIEGFRLDSSSGGFERFTEEGCAALVDGDVITVSRLLDVLGTWVCKSGFRLSEQGFELVQTDSIWTVVETVEGRWCTVSEMILVGLYTSGVDNESTFLDPGVRLFPVSTDMSSNIDVMLDTGAPAYMTVTLGANGELIYSGYPLTHWFSDLTFID